MDFSYALELGLVGGLVLGVLLGLLGGGGALLALPILTIAFRVPLTDATHLSLGVVAVGAWFGVAFSILQSPKGKRTSALDWKAALQFLIPSSIGVWFGKKILLPHLPSSITLFGTSISLDRLILSLLCLIMLLAARSLLRRPTKVAALQGGPASLETDATPVLPLKERGKAILEAGGLGLLTSVSGIGGGFLIVPWLTLRRRVEIKKAAVTSLLLIGANSSFGFLLKAEMAQHFLVWPLNLFLGLVILGIVIGRILVPKIAGEGLRKGFGIFLIIIAVLLLLTSL